MPERRRTCSGSGTRASAAYTRVLVCGFVPGLGEIARCRRYAPCSPRRERGQYRPVGNGAAAPPTCVSIDEREALPPWHTFRPTSRARYAFRSIRPRFATSARAVPSTPHSPPASARPSPVP